MTEHVDPVDLADNVVRLPRRPAEPPPLASIETEQGLLGALMVDPSVYPTIQHLVAAEHFAEPTHRALFQVIADLASTGAPTDYRIVRAAVGPKIAAHDLGGLTIGQYLARLVAEAGLPVSAPEYARVVQQFWQLRELDYATAAGPDDAAVIPARRLNEVYARIDEIRAAYLERKVASATLAQAGSDLVDAIGADLRGEARPLPSTGLVALDREIGGGLTPSSLLTVAARTSMGKSVFGVEILGAVAGQGYGCVYHSLEMSRRQIAARMAASHLERRGVRLPYEQIMRRGGLNPREAEAVAGAVHDQRGLPFTIEDGGGRTIAEIANASDRLANHYARKGLPFGAIVIDHAHIVRPARAYKREDEGFKEVADGALALAKHLDCPVILLAQCNRGTESREDKRPGLADIRGAGAFEENSDAVLFLFRPAYYVERTPAFRDNDPEARDAFDAVRHSLEIIIDKNRAGRSNQIVPAWIDIALNAIRDAAFGG